MRLLSIMTGQQATLNLYYTLIIMSGKYIRDLFSQINCSRITILSGMAHRFEFQVIRQILFPIFLKKATMPCISLTRCWRTTADQSDILSIIPEAEQNIL